MAGEKKEEKHEKLIKAIQDPSSSVVAMFKLDPNAPEFIPDPFIQMPIPDYFRQYLELLNHDGGRMESDCINLEDQKSMHSVSDLNVKAPKLKMNSTDDLIQKIVKKVECQFSDLYLIASNFLVKMMNKDPEGYVPMSVIAAWKKIKNLGINNQTLIKALRTSSKLVVSEDGIKVRRKKLFTEKDKQEMTSRTVIVENLSEDSSRQTIEKIFSTVGSVKNVIICHPREPNSTRPLKSDAIISNKLHAYVEFETTDQADKAVKKLHDESNWRKGLRVRSLVKPTPKSIITSKRSDHYHFDVNLGDGQSPLSQNLQSPKIEHVLQQNNGAKKAWGRGRGKPTSLIQNNNNGYNVLSKIPKGAQSIKGHGVCENYIKQAPGPKMPDGTRGFTMGRGKPSLKSLMATTDHTPKL